MLTVGRTRATDLRRRLRPAGAAGRPARAGRRAARRRPWRGGCPRRPGSRGRPGAALPHRRAGRLEQGVALLEHPVVVGAHAGQPRRTRDQQVVEEPAALGRVALDDREVLGREQHGPQQAQHLPGPRHRRAVDAGPVGPTWGQLELDERRPVVAHHAGAHDGTLGAEPDQRSVGRDPMAAEGRDVADRLDQVGLALAVRPDHRGHAGLQRQLDRRVRTEVHEREVGDVHAAGAAQPDRRTGMSR